MNVERTEHAACVLDGKMFVIGGSDKDDIAVKTMEWYDPTLDDWAVVGDTKNGFCGRKVLAV